MSAALKIATIASGFSIFSISTFYTLRNPQRDFSQNALALEHTGEAQSITIPKPKVPSNFMAFTIGGYEIKTSV